MAVGHLRLRDCGPPEHRLIKMKKRAKREAPSLYFPVRAIKLPKSGGMALGEGMVSWQKEAQQRQMLKAKRQRDCDSSIGNRSEERHKQSETGRGRQNYNRQKIQ